MYIDIYIYTYIYILCLVMSKRLSNGWPFSLLNDEQMSHKVRVEHQPEYLWYVIVCLYNYTYIYIFPWSPADQTIRGLVFWMFHEPKIPLRTTNNSAKGLVGLNFLGFNSKIWGLISCDLFGVKTWPFQRLLVARTDREVEVGSRLESPGNKGPPPKTYPFPRNSRPHDQGWLTIGFP